MKSASTSGDPPRIELKIDGMRGSEQVEHNSVLCCGDAGGAREVVEGSIAFVERYSRALAEEGFAAAYELVDMGLREIMSRERFVKLHEEGDDNRWCRSPLLEFRIERIAYIVTDDAAREATESAKDDWPKGTAKANRRSRVIGHWIRDRVEQTICRGAIWISEENGEYRMANMVLTGR
jgi:hypothetical protein